MDENDKRDLHRQIGPLLRALAARDEKAAELACDKLLTLSEPYLRRYFYGLVGNEDLEDVLQSTAIKIWHARDIVGKLVAATWPNYVLTVAKNCARDMWRKQEQERRKFTEAIKYIPEQDRQEVDRFLAVLIQGDGLERFLHHADVLWLGLDPTLSAATHRRQALAAQLYYLDGESLDEIIQLLPPAAGETLLTPDLLEEWLTHESVIRALVYNRLFYTHDRLAWHMLGRTGLVKTIELDALTGAACGLGDPVTPEVVTILWRYRFGMRPEEILGRSDCPLNREHLMALIASLDARTPFYSVMENLITRLSPVLGAEKATCLLRSPGLWQRLAFQYHYVTGPMTLQDVYARLAAPAQQVGYEISVGNLNVWLSGKRLIMRLARFIARQQGELSNE